MYNLSKTQRNRGEYLSRIEGWAGVAPYKNIEVGWRITRKASGKL